MDSSHIQSNYCFADEWALVSLRRFLFKAKKSDIKFGLISLIVDVYGHDGPSVNTFTCNQPETQTWIWNETDGTVRNKYRDEYLIAPLEPEVWAGPLSNGSEAVVLLNRGENDNEQITVQWADIGFPVDRAATVRDLWAHQDLGVFTGNYTSPNIASHGVMMLNITLTK